MTGAAAATGLLGAGDEFVGDVTAGGVDAAATAGADPDPDANLLILASRRATRSRGSSSALPPIVACRTTPLVPPSESLESELLFELLSESVCDGEPIIMSSSDESSSLDALESRSPAWPACADASGSGR